MSTTEHLDQIIGHLGAAAIQRSSTDDIIIAFHIDAALLVARLAKRELQKAQT